MTTPSSSPALPGKVTARPAQLTDDPDRLPSASSPQSGVTAPPSCADHGTDQNLSSPQGPLWREKQALALLLAASLTVMANATISPALPRLEALFAQDPNAELLTRLLVPAPSLTVIFCAPLSGWLADRYGRRWLLLTGVVLFVLTGSAGAYLPDLTSIFASRLALGVAVAMIMTAQTALIGDYYVGARRSAITGLQTSARNFGGFAFITLAGWLALYSPRLPFAIYALAGLMLPFLWVAITEPLRTPTKTNKAATPSSERVSANWPWLVAALAALQMLTNLTFFLMPTQVPFFLDSLGYDSAPMTGLVLGVLTLTGGMTALLFSRIKGVLGAAGLFALGYGLMAGGFALLPLGGQLWALLLAAGAIGAGFALVMPNFVSLVLHLAPASHRGLAGGVLTTAVFLGQFCSPFISIPAIAAWGFDGTYHSTAALLTLLALIALLHHSRRFAAPLR
ncbi:MFS transporter [Rhodovibrionaceae bacterium A322]